MLDAWLALRTQVPTWAKLTTAPRMVQAPLVVLASTEKVTLLPLAPPPLEVTV